MTAASFLPLQGGGRDGEAVRVGASLLGEAPLSARYASPVSPLQGEKDPDRTHLRLRRLGRGRRMFSIARSSMPSVPSNPA